MKKKLLWLGASLMSLCLSSCVKEITETTTNFESSDIPEVIPYTGGTYTLTLKPEIQTKSRTENTDIAWAYRINYDDIEGEAVVFDAPQESVQITIGANNTDCIRQVSVDFSSDSQKTWLQIAQSEQKADPAKIKDLFSDFGTTNLPKKIGYNGGDYYFTLTFRKEDPSLKSAPITTFIPWSYRICYDGVNGEAVKIEEKTDKVTFHVEGNYSEKDIKVSLEIANNKAQDNWTEVASTTQEAGLLGLGEDGISYFYAKSDLIVKDGKFALADAPQATGYFFRHESHYAVPADEVYAGVAYNPQSTNMAISDIEEKTGADPCTLLSEKLRTPSYQELYMLYYMEDTDNTSTVEDVQGTHYKGSDLFLPFNGYVNIPSGNLMGKNATGARWGLGTDFDGNGLVLTSNLQYSVAPAFDYVGENMASVRCVKNIKLPSLVKVEPSELESCRSTEVTITTDPGEFLLYEVSLEANDGTVKKATATNNKTSVTITLPDSQHTDKATEWKVFVNNIYTEQTLLQPALSDFVYFIGYTPTTGQDYTAFTITVNIETDHESVEVKASGSNGKEIIDFAGKDKGKVELAIPENTESQPVVWTLWIDGESTGKTISQKGAPASSLSVDWSTGYLTVKDGAYCFAEPSEKGAYFPWKSKYAITSAPFDKKAYGPEETAFDKMASIPNSDVDPCSLVAPAGTWRMPTVSEFEELFTCEYTGTLKDNVTFTLPDASLLVFKNGGQISGSSGKGMLLDSSIVIWVDAESDSDKAKAKYVMISNAASTGTPKVNAGTAKINGINVRCVKSH